MHDKSSVMKDNVPALCCTAVPAHNVERTLSGRGYRCAVPPLLPAWPGKEEIGTIPLIEDFQDHATFKEKAANTASAPW